MKLVDGTEDPPGVRHLAKWLCRACESETGVASTVTVLVNVGGFYEKGTFKPGHKARVCAMCLTRGEVTRVD